MPIKVKIQIFAAVSVGLVISFYLALWSIWAAVALVLIALLYAEMLNPQWNFFGTAVTSVRDRGENVVSISFDDGPSEYTEQMLDILKKYDVKATFFLLGKNVLRHPETARRIQSEGHAIGIHGNLHKKYHRSGPWFINKDIDDCIKAFEEVGIKHNNLIRFPHGSKNIFAVHAAKKRGLKLCSWNRGVWDSRHPGIIHILEKSLETKAGEILLFHDGFGITENPDRSQTTAVLEPVLSAFKAKGFKTVTLS